MADSNTTIKLIDLDNLSTYHSLMDAKKEEHSITLTQAQYNALTPEEKMNGKTYYISDAGSSGMIITASDVLMTGYSKASSASAITTNDTGSIAFGKLEKGLEDTNSDVDDIEALIPSSATTSNKLATAADIPGVATASTVGLVKPDGTTITIDANGAITAVGSTPQVETRNFEYTGSVQTFTAPETNNYKLEVWGAQGGTGQVDVHGGYGGYSVGTVSLTEGDTIYICVGGMGGGSSTYDPTNAGYNGGGLGNYEGSRGNGGGATHIATTTGTLSSLSSTPSSILIVAGGGGGAGFYAGEDCGNGGSGGGYIGGHGFFVNSTTGDENSHTGSGGTQVTGGATEDYSTQSTGSFGLGASRDDSELWGGSGGGGGYYGGGASTNNAGAGGGSGYINISALTNACMYGYSVQESVADATKTISVLAYNATPTPAQAKVGNGYARISWDTEAINYNDLNNKPKINNVTLSGNKTSSDLGLASTSALNEKADESLLADAFSTSIPYEIGDVVVYNNKLYCFFGTKSAGAWDSSIVYETTVDAVMKLGAMSNQERNKLRDLYVPKTYRGGSTSFTGLTDQYINGKLNISPIDPNILKANDVVYFKADYEIHIGVYQQLSDFVKIKVTYGNTTYYIYPNQPSYNSVADPPYSWSRTSQLIVPKGGMLVLSGFREGSTANTFDCNIINFVNNNQFVLKGWLYEGDTTLTFSDSRLTDTSILEVYFDENHYDLTWNTFTESNNQSGFSLTFDPQSEDILVTVLVTNVTSDKDGYDGTSS